MKKFLLIVLAALIALYAAGCTFTFGSGSESDDLKIFFRLKNEGAADGAVIDCEYRSIKDRTPENALATLMLGPTDTEKFSLTFQRGVKVLSMEREGNTALVTMSDEFGRMDGVEQSIANACITGTLLQFDDIENVVISYNDRDGKKSKGPFTEDSFELLMSRSENVEYAVELYFVDSEVSALTVETETLVASDPDTVEKFIIGELLSGPRNSKNLPALPVGTEVLGIYSDKNVCYVDFNSAFTTGMSQSPARQLLTVYSVVNSVTCVPGVERVQLLIDGSVVQYYGGVPIGEPLAFDSTLVHKSGSGYIDTALFLKREGQDFVTEHYWQISSAEFATKEQLIVETLLNMDVPYGYESLFNEGTELRTIATRDGVCYVDLTNAFLDAQNRDILFGAYSISASLLKLDGVDTVVLTCGGKQVKNGSFCLPEEFDLTNVMIG